MDSKPLIPQNHTHAEMLEFHAKTLKEIFDISPDDYKVVLLNTDVLYVSELIETFEKSYGIKLSIHPFRNSHMNWEIGKAKSHNVGLKLLWQKPKVMDIGDLGNNSEIVTLTCQSCGKEFQGIKPKICCSGKDCSCMGKPIDPIICDDCWNIKLM